MQACAGEEGVRDGDAGEVVIQAAVGAAFVVIKAEALLEFAVIVLDAPAQLGRSDERLDWRVLGQISPDRASTSSGPDGRGR
jgi:hypothetical protein